MSRIRLYMTFLDEWVATLEDPGTSLLTAIVENLSRYGECYSNYDYYEGIVILDIVSDRNAEAIRDIISESFLEHFAIADSTFDIEIDLEVPLEVVDWDSY